MQLCRLTFVWRISTIHVPKFFYCWIFFPGITFCCYKNYRDIGEFVPKFWPNNCLHFVERGHIRCRITKDNYIRFWVSVGPWNRRKEVTRMFNRFVWIAICNYCQSTKGGFFSESAIRFFKSPNLRKNIFQKSILSLKFKFPPNDTLLLLAGNLNFKFKIVFWNIYFWRFGDLKKSHL